MKLPFFVDALDVDAEKGEGVWNLEVEALPISLLLLLLPIDLVPPSLSLAEEIDADADADALLSNLEECILRLELEPRC